MLVAAKGKRFHEPASEVRSSKKSAKNCGHAGRILCIFGAIISVFAFGVYYTSLSAVIASKGYEIEKLDREIMQLETTNERTELMVASMSSLDKVEQVATQRLGMNKPDNTKNPMVIASAQTAVAGNVNPEDSDKGKMAEEEGFSAKKLFTAFSSFFEIGKAQASPATK